MQQVKTFLDLFEHAIVIVGAWRAWVMMSRARRRGDVVHRAQGAAGALGFAGIIIWGQAVLDEANGTFSYTAYRPTVMGVLNVIGASVLWGIFILVPMWAPWWLLSGRPGPGRRTLVILISYGVALFAGGIIGLSPLMFGFASSFREWVVAILGVATPLLILILIAMTTASWLAGSAQSTKRETRDVPYGERRLRRGREERPTNPTP